MLVLVRYLSYTPHASFIEVFLLHISCYFLVRCFSYTAHASFSEVFLSVTLLMLVFVRCFSYTPHASFKEVFLLRASCYF